MRKVIAGMDAPGRRTAAAASTVVVERPLPSPAAPPILAAGAESLGGLLDQIISATAQQAAAPVAARAALAAPTDNAWPTIVAYVRQHVADETARRRLKHEIGRAVARIDQLVGQTLDLILHHPKFQKLEASWRGLESLVHRAEPGEGVIIRFLDVRWSEVIKDQLNALEFDQSEVFRKVYDEEFGMAGGHPYGLLIGDYEVSNHPQEVEALERLSSPPRARRYWD